MGGRWEAGVRALRGRSRSTPTRRRWRPRSELWRSFHRWCSRVRCVSWRSGSARRPWVGHSSCRAATAPRASGSSMPKTSATPSGSFCRWPSFSHSADRCPPSRSLILRLDPCLLCSSSSPLIQSIVSSSQVILPVVNPRLNA